MSWSVTDLVPSRREIPQLEKKQKKKPLKSFWETELVDVYHPKQRRIAERIIDLKDSIDLECPGDDLSGKKEGKLITELRHEYRAWLTVSKAFTDKYDDVPLPAADYRDLLTDCLNRDAEELLFGDPFLKSMKEKRNLQ